MTRFYRDWVRTWGHDYKLLRKDFSVRFDVEKFRCGSRACDEWYNMQTELNVNEVRGGGIWRQTAETESLLKIKTCNKLATES